MSGHSKWHNIQGKKGKADKVKSSSFTKAARAITIAARQGGGDLDMNFALRLAVDKAKEVNMPKDNIDRAIKRGTGELKDEVVVEEGLYEGFGPGGVAFMVEALTDNKTRTVSEIKNFFSKLGGSLGGPGSVQWQFTRSGVIRIGKERQDTLGAKAGEFELALMDAGVEDIIQSEFGMEIRSSVESFQSVLDVVKRFDIIPDDSGLEWVAKEPVMLDPETKEKVARLYETLDELDDVRAVYTNEA